MNAAHHAKLRASGWRYDPISERYSAPDAVQDGTQRMYTQSEAWERYEAAQTKERAAAAKAKDDEKAST